MNEFSHGRLQLNPADIMRAWKQVKDKTIHRPETGLFDTLQALRELRDAVRSEYQNLDSKPINSSGVFDDVQGSNAFDVKSKRKHSLGVDNALIHADLLLGE